MLEKIDLTKKLSKAEYKAQLTYLRDHLYDLQKACFDARAHGGFDPFLPALLGRAERVLYAFKDDGEGHFFVQYELTAERTEHVHAGVGLPAADPEPELTGSPQGSLCFSAFGR